MASPPTSLSMTQVIDDETLLMGFYDFCMRYHAEETLLFWMSVEVFRNRNWKAAKFFGMDEDQSTTSAASSSSASATASNQQPPVRRGSKLAAIITSPIANRRPSKDMSSPSLGSPGTANRRGKTSENLQRKLDEASAKKMDVPLEQLYLIKEADFIFDTFVKTGGEFWTCFDFKVASMVQRKLQDPKTLTRDVFAEAQAASFAEMNDDLLPRFLKEVNEAGSATPNAKPLTSEMKKIKDRVLLLSKAVPRRKTGVSTALAFTFSVARPIRKPIERKEIGNQSAGVDNSASLLRTMSSMKILGAAEGSVHALPLSRDRLSNKGIRPINDDGKCPAFFVFGLCTHMFTGTHHHVLFVFTDIGPPIPRPSGLRPRPSGLGVHSADKRGSTPFPDRRSHERRDEPSSRPRSYSDRTGSGRSTALDAQNTPPKSRIVSVGHKTGDGTASLSVDLNFSRTARGLSF